MASCEKEKYILRFEVSSVAFLKMCAKVYLVGAIVAQRVMLGPLDVAYFKPVLLAGSRLRRFDGLTGSPGNGQEEDQKNQGDVKEMGYPP